MNISLYCGDRVQYANLDLDSAINEIHYWQTHVEECKWIRGVYDIKHAVLSSDYGVMLIGTRPRTEINGNVRPPRGITVIWKQDDNRNPATSER